MNVISKTGLVLYESQFYHAFSSRLYEFSENLFESSIKVAVKTKYRLSDILLTLI